MSNIVQSSKPRRTTTALGPAGALSRASVSALAALLDFAVVVVAAMTCGVIYYAVALDSIPPFSSHLGWGGAIALTFVVVAALRGDYGLDAYRGASRRLMDLWLNWTIAIAVVVFAMFVLKASVDVSRGATILLYGVGFLALIGGRKIGRRCLRLLDTKGRIRSKRMLVVGSDHAVATDAAVRIKNATRVTTREVAANRLSEPFSDLVTIARQFDPDEIVLVFRLDEAERIDRIADVLSVIPAGMRLLPEGGRFGAFRAEAVSGEWGIPLMRPPLTATEQALKRAMDLAGASALLVALSPLLLLVALAIRIQSPGPALFRQTRHGFNQKPFRIFKFRTMTVMEDGKAFTQARAGDPRITRLGQFLRRTNLDELPQLFNVLSGDMSLVGPRPHPIALDESFDSRIVHYARRNAIKPGITGWAQVHGFRGETDTIEKMQGRVEYDLAYIESWSVGLDFQILLMTLFSRMAYRNAG